MVVEEVVFADIVEGEELEGRFSGVWDRAFDLDGLVGEDIEAGAVRLLDLAVLA